MNTKILIGIALAMGSLTACGEEGRGAWQKQTSLPGLTGDVRDVVPFPDNQREDGPGHENPCVTEVTTNTGMTDVLPTGTATAAQLLQAFTKQMQLSWVDGWHETAEARAAAPSHSATLDIVFEKQEVESFVRTPVDPKGQYAHLCISTFSLPVSVRVNRTDVLSSTLSGTLTGNIDGSGFELSATAPLAAVKGTLKPDYAWMKENVDGFNVATDGDPTTSLELSAKMKAGGSDHITFDGQLDWFVDSVDTFLTFAMLAPQGQQK